MTHRETDSDTANPYRQQLLKAGVPEAMHDMLRHHGVGDLVEKMEITFLSDREVFGDLVDDAPHAPPPE